jgi:hypothetical protein
VRRNLVRFLSRRSRLPRELDKSHQYHTPESLGPDSVLTAVAGTLRTLVVVAEQWQLADRWQNHWEEEPFFIKWFLYGQGGDPITRGRVCVRAAWCLQKFGVYKHLLTCTCGSSSANRMQKLHASDRGAAL